MGSRFSIPLDIQEIDALSRETELTVPQLNSFYRRFNRLSRGEPMLTKDDLLREQDLITNPLCDRILHAFFANGRSALTFAEFARQLAVFRRSKRPSSREAKLRFLFSMLDVGGSGFVSAAEMTAFLMLLLGDSVSDEQLGSISLRCLSEADDDGDNRVTFEEFAKALGTVEIEEQMCVAALNG
ncbi:hypothetical protein BOX15_Mlig007755g1 [Macrostomum lignano]|uniref:EF-hand domain-containing protein n=1 Tax=Macrostomum lignano TaxID=282301 RepID=A0A267ENB5_9PLAT|nr:hypothetical protein BOX15_Mlig007755g1 [Macrostomum lignano]